MENTAAEGRLTGTWTVAGLSGVVGTHAALLHTGQVLFFTRPEDPSHKWSSNDNGLPGDGTRQPVERDVTLSTVFGLAGADRHRPRAVPVAYNPFCAGHTFLADGSLLVAGGDKKDFNYAGVPAGTRFGLDGLQLFVPEQGGTGHWKRTGQMEDGRWYPTCTLLPDGRVFIISGSLDDQPQYNNQNPTCELFPATPEGPQYLHFLVEAWPYCSYPFVFGLPSGALFVFIKDSAYYLNLVRDRFGRERWKVRNGPKLNGEGAPGNRHEPAKHYPNNATAVLLPLLPEKDYAAEVMVAGGAGADIYLHFSPGDIPGFHCPTHEIEATANCFRLLTDQENGGGTWRKAQSMAHPRVMPDAVLLPDGTVLVVNGVRRGFAGGNPATGPVLPEHAVQTAELYDPVRDQWQSLATAKCPRLYHSTALLLPDGRVMVAGSDHQVNYRAFKKELTKEEYNREVARCYEYQVEVFTPPYLLRGDRPQFTLEAEQRQLAYGQPFSIRVDGLAGMKDTALRAALLRPGSVTHNNNMNQRHVGLKITKRSDPYLTLEAPPDAHIAPPGYYMLFLLHDGIPSEAVFVHLPAAPILVPSEGPDPATEDNAGEAHTPPAGMALWLRADTGLATDQAGTVQHWSDQSGRGNDVFQKPNEPRNFTRDALQRPPRLLQRALNGHPVVRFLVTDNDLHQWGGYLESGRPFLQGSGPYAVFIVAHPWPSGNKGPGPTEERGTPGLLGWGAFDEPEDRNAVVVLRLGPGPRSNNPPDSEHFFNRLPKEPGKASAVTYWGSQQLGDDSKAPLSCAGAFLLETDFDGTQCRMRCNGQVFFEGPAPVRNTGAGPLLIGRNGPRGNYFRGDIAEILVYDRNLEAEERRQVQEYLRVRYALW